MSPVAVRLLKLLGERGPLRGRQIDRHFSQVDWRNTARSLVRMGLLASHSILPPPTVRPKYIRTAQLAVAPSRGGSRPARAGKDRSHPCPPPGSPALPGE